MVQKQSTLVAAADSLLFIGASVLILGWAAAVSAPDQMPAPPSVANLSAEVTDALISLSWVQPGRSSGGGGSGAAAAAVDSSLSYLVSACVDGSGWRVLGACAAPCSQYTVQRQLISETAAAGQWNFSVVTYRSTAHSDPIFAAVNVTRADAAQSTGLIVGVSVAVSALCGLLILASVQIARLLISRKAARQDRTGRMISARTARPTFQERMSAHLPKQLRPDELYGELKSPSANESGVFLTTASGECPTASSALGHTPEAESGASDLGFYSDYWRRRRRTAGHRARDARDRDVRGGNAWDTGGGGSMTEAGRRWASPDRAYALGGGDRLTIDSSYAGDSSGAASAAAIWAGRSSAPRWRGSYDDSPAVAGGLAASSGGCSSSRVERASSSEASGGARRSSNSGGNVNCAERSDDRSSPDAGCCPFSASGLATVRTASEGAARNRIDSRRLPRRAAYGAATAALVDISDVSLLGRVSLQDSFIPHHLFTAKPGKEVTFSTPPHQDRQNGGGAAKERLSAVVDDTNGGGGSAEPLDLLSWPSTLDRDYRERSAAAGSRHQAAGSDRLAMQLGGTAATISSRSRPEAADRWHSHRSPTSGSVERSSSFERPGSLSLPSKRALHSLEAAASDAAGGGGGWRLQGGGGGGSWRLPGDGVSGWRLPGDGSRSLEREPSESAAPPPQPLAYSSPLTSLLLDCGAGLYASSRQASSSSSLQTLPSHAEQRYSRERLRRAVEAVRTKAVPAAASASGESTAAALWAASQSGGWRGSPAEAAARGPYDDDDAASEKWLSAVALSDSRQAIQESNRLNMADTTDDRSHSVWQTGDGQPHNGLSADDGFCSETERTTAFGWHDLESTLTFYASPLESDLGVQWQRAAGVAPAVVGLPDASVSGRWESPPASGGLQWGSRWGADDIRTFERDQTSAHAGPKPPLLPPWATAGGDVDRVEKLLRELHQHQSNGGGDGHPLHGGDGDAATAWEHWPLETDV